MRFGSRVAPVVLRAAALLASGCGRTLDFEALGGEPDGTPAQGSDPAGPTETARPETTLDGGFSCRAISPAPVFCDDFDGPSLADVWDEILSAPADGGAVVHDADDVLSPPRALRVSVAPGMAAGTYVSMGLHQALPESSAARRIDVDFDMKVEQHDAKPERDIVAFQLLLGKAVAGTERNQLVLNLQTADGALRARFNENLLAFDGSSAASTQHAFHPQPVVGQWTHVSFTLDAQAPSGGKNRVLLRIGPRDAFERASLVLFDGLLEHDLRAGQPHMEVGIPWLRTPEPTAAWRIRYDNVLVRIREE